MSMDRVECEVCTPRGGSDPPELVGRDAGLERLRAQIRAVSDRNSTVLICGESGTGKELVARQIHAASRRAAGPFVTVDCTTLRDTLFESQLFGHVKGAFTGAEQSTLGLYRAAAGGTLFVDEIGELEPHIQGKLLRCMQDNAVVPLGGVTPVPVDVRIIVATHRDLKQMVRLGTFREDLYFRLNVVRLDVAPLRTRRGDILPLAEHFLAQLATLYQEPVKTLAPDAQAALEHYAWPGNVRELRNAIEHAFVFAGGHCIKASGLPKAIRPVGPIPPNGHQRKIVALEVAERCLIKRALRATNGNKSLAARLLGVERHRFGRLISRHGLEALIGSDGH